MTILEASPGMDSKGNKRDDRFCSFVVNSILVPWELTEVKYAFSSPL